MTTLSRRTTLGLIASSLAAPALAQTDYPNRPVTVIVPQAAGGANDIIGRLVSEKLSEVLGPVSYTHLDVYKRQR